MRLLLDCLREELCDPRPGTPVIAQQLASTLLIQALRAYFEEPSGESRGWLFALADPQLKNAISCVQDDPGRHWTLQ